LEGLLEREVWRGSSNGNAPNRGWVQDPGLATFQISSTTPSTTYTTTTTTAAPPAFTPDNPINSILLEHEIGTINQSDMPLPLVKTFHTSNAKAFCYWLKQSRNYDEAMKRLDQLKERFRPLPAGSSVTFATP